LNTKVKYLLKVNLLFVFYVFCFAKDINAQFYVKANKFWNIDSALIYFNKHLKKEIINKNTDAQFEYRLLLAKNYLNLPNYKKAKQQIDSAKLLLDDKSLLQKNMIKSIEADYCKYIDNDEAALKNYLSVLSYFEKNKTHEFYFKTLVDLVEIYRKAANFNESSKYIQLSKLLLSKNNVTDTNQIIRFYGRAAAVKNETKQIDSSIFYSNLALKWAVINKNKYAEATAYNELAFAFKGKGSFKKAEELYLKAENAWYSISANREAINAFFSRIELRVHTIEGRKAKIENIALFNDLLNRIKANNTTTDLRRIYVNMSNEYRFIGDSINCLYYENLSLQETIKILQSNNKVKIQEITEKYENAKTQAEINEVKKELELKKISSQREQKEKTLIYILFFGALVFSTIVIYFLIIRNKANKLLAKKNKEKDILIQEVHHRVKNNLTTLKSLFFLQAKSCKSEEVREVLTEAQSRIQSMALIHQNLYDMMADGIVKFDVFLKQISYEHENSFKPKDKEIRINLSGIDLDVNISKALFLGLVLNELMINSYKYAFQNIEDGEINISLNSDIKKLKVVYSDNGVGLKENEDLSKGGFGFKLIRILTEQMNGEIHYKRFNNLSQFIIEIDNE
jgi:two-component sensor histidine kinase